MRANGFTSSRPRRWLGSCRVLNWACWGLLTATVAVGVLAACLQLEDRFPAEDPARAIAPSVQRVLSKPLADAVARQVGATFRRRLESRYLNNGLTLEATLARFLDERLDLAHRRTDAFRIARAGSPECLTALRTVLHSAPPEHKANLARLIGESGNPAVRDLLYPLLDDVDDRVVVGAIQGLASLDGIDVVERIAALLADPRRPERIRIEAARALGVLDSPVARVELVEAIHQPASDALAAQVLSSLGTCDFAEVAEVFTGYLGDPRTPRRMRGVAVEALARSTPLVVPFLLEVAAADQDPEVRASAAWSLSGYPAVDDLALRLVELAEREASAEVRQRLYEASLPQSGIPGERLATLVIGETDIAARIAGFNALAAAVARQPTAVDNTWFDERIVPELLQVATHPNSLDLQLRAVFALRRARTPAARSALAAIVQTASPQVATAAGHGLATPGS